MKNKLTGLRDILLAGSAGLNTSEIKSYTKRINEYFSIFTSQKTKLNSDEIINLKEFLEALINSDLIKPIVTTVNLNSLFLFGGYLKDNNDNESDELIPIYLDLIRFSEILSRIEEQEKWAILFNTLIKKSNYTFSKMFDARVNMYGDKPLFKTIKGGEVTAYTWQQINTITNQYINSLNYFRNHEPAIPSIAFLLENSFTMANLDIACIRLGMVNVMIPANSVPQHISFILNQTKVKTLIASNEKQLAKIKTVKTELENLETVILLEGSSAEKWVITFDEFLNINEDKIDKKNLPEVDVNKLASIMYTSGTTGEPKGICFSHLNIIYKRFCRAIAIPTIGDEDRFICYLPLFHTFGRYFEMMGAIFWGAEYIFMENPSAETMIANMNVVKPTIFISIPKKWIQIYEHVKTSIDLEHDEEEMIKAAIDSTTGGELRLGLSAAGFLSTEIFEFFQRNGIELMSGFGMTEATGGITMTPPGKYRFNSLGKALPGIEVKLADDGELLIKGDYVMERYFAEDTTLHFEDGWFKTGDIMKNDEDGYLEIIDRKKEIYKNIKGETIAPQKIENFFKEFDEIDQVFLAGDHRPYNTLLIYPDQIQKTVISGMNETQQQEYFNSVVVTVNKFLAPFERIIDFRIIDRKFSAELGELTAKGTYKRRIIENNFDSLINLMYQKNYTELNSNGIEVRIPNWFLREKGCLSRDIDFVNDKIAIKNFKNSLTIKKIEDCKNQFQIGNYIFEINTHYIDLQILLTNPKYWLGNAELYKFCGGLLIQWYRNIENNNSIKIIKPIEIFECNTKTVDEISHINEAGEVSLFGIHTAVQLLNCSEKENSANAVKYLNFLTKNKEEKILELINYILFRPFFANNLSIHRELLKLALTIIEAVDFVQLLNSYHKISPKILNDELILVIIDVCEGKEFLTAIEELTSKEVVAICKSKDLQSSSIESLFSLLAEYGINHPTSYESIRQFFVQIQLRRDWKVLKDLAIKYRTDMRIGFRNWLGNNERVSVDMETGEEYKWKDVIIFEDEIKEEFKEKIFEAITTTAILREAIFMFSGGKLIRLTNILPGGIWISHYRSFEDKDVFRVSVQTRMQGSFDVLLNLNKGLSFESIKEEVNWMILAGSRHFVQELVEDFGGYWEDSNIWTGKFIAGDSINKFISRSLRKNQESETTRLKFLWPFFIWNSAAAYFNYWKLTGYKLKLYNCSIDNFIVPSHDYQTGTKVITFTGRAEYKSLTDLVIDFYNQFISYTEKDNEFLINENSWQYIFSGLINAEGEETGLKLLKQLLVEQQESKNPNSKLISSLQKFIGSIDSLGYIPKQLYFAIKRFDRWFILNENASYSVQAQMLNDLYDTYRLKNLEITYPETRTRFFYETVFKFENDELKSVLEEIIIKQHKFVMPKEEFQKEISVIQTEFNLTKGEDYFLTRLSYPYLKPTDSAEIMKFKTEGSLNTNLVVEVEDYEGIPYFIRKPISPKEISKLHQLFIEANLLVNFGSNHDFLVAISERGFIIGGIFYKYLEKNIVHMEKIVVSNRYRRKGISEGIMKEFFNRQKNDQIKYVTTGFFRPEYFYRFGFKIERKHSGLAKKL